jgi:hypothetical protein
MFSLSRRLTAPNFRQRQLRAPKSQAAKPSLNGCKLSGPASGHANINWQLAVWKSYRAMEPLKTSCNGGSRLIAD